eukprot:6856499-Pyramimonas_sp.AAC.1
MLRARAPKACLQELRQDGELLHRAIMIVLVVMGHAVPPMVKNHAENLAWCKRRCETSASQPA